MAPLASNLTIASNHTLSSWSSPNTTAFDATSASTNSSNPSPDLTGTIIFGVIASVLAIMAILIAYLQLRKASSQAMLPLSTLPPVPAATTTPPPTAVAPAVSSRPTPAPAPPAKEDV